MDASKLRLMGIVRAVSDGRRTDVGRSSDGRRTAVGRADGRSGPTAVPFFPVRGSGGGSPQGPRGVRGGGSPPDWGGLGGRSPPRKKRLVTCVEKQGFYDKF